LSTRKVFSKSCAIAGYCALPTSLLGDVLLEVAVDQDQSVRRRDEVAGEGFGADVVEIPGDMERWKGLGPRRIDLRRERQGRSNAKSD